MIAQVESKTDTQDFIGLQGMYTMGQNVFALGYSMTSADDSAVGVADLDNTNSIYVQALHNLSDNMYVYLEFLSQTDVVADAATGTQIDVDTLALGATYAF